MRTSECEGEAYGTCTVVRNPCQTAGPPPLSPLLAGTELQYLQLHEISNICLPAGKTLDLHSEMVGSNLVQNIEYSD
jgi:hypothetical protein